MFEEHTSTRYGESLEEVRSQFLRMGGLVESMINDAVESLSTGDTALIERVFAYEVEVNKLEIEIDSLITQVIARQQPAAIDLRLLLSITKMVTDLERCGDESEKIARTARRLYDQNIRFGPIVELNYMGSLVSQNLHEVLDAFARLDPVAAARVVRADKKINKEWRSVLRETSSFMIEDPRTITTAIDVIFMARALERIGDHAKNMAERVIYTVQGEDVRHTGSKNILKVASRYNFNVSVDADEESDSDEAEDK
ncbi:Phosphate transport system protein phoU [Oligella ureolytica]|uniref:Phosphate-specific transport system accessory protein PhoU n=1 Tax=Oligella ureolytica TaxID=90244 RepID=A0A378XI78_9BURK|nr:phosphate signaling complex protein PhoU [Oligella ureolytica]QPT39882.1 phosphate signaling complex protein PhoU [Oligella ureolytica]SUA57873.1 Phosphate transport system protein phoU [Oligella ureolytica]